jgi:hypothetical protein
VKEIDNFGDLDIEVEIILKLMLKKGVLECWFGLSVTGQSPIDVSFEQGNRSWGYVKLKYVFDQVDEYKLFKKDSVPWN